MLAGDGMLAAQIMCARLNTIPDLHITPYMRDLLRLHPEPEPLPIDDNPNAPVYSAVKRAYNFAVLEGSIAVESVEATSTMARDGSQLVTWALDIAIPSGFSATRRDAEMQAETRILNLCSYDPTESIWGIFRGWTGDTTGIVDGNGDRIRPELEFVVHIPDQFTRGFRISDSGTVKEHVLSGRLTAII